MTDRSEVDIRMTAPPALPPEAEHADLRAIHAYWCSKWRDGRMPGRRDIDPIEIPSLLARLTIYEIERGERLRFRIRLMGSRLVRAAGRDLTGRYLDQELDPGRYPDIHAQLEHLVATGEPKYRDDPLSIFGRDHIRLCRLALPLAGDGATIDGFLTLYVEMPWPLDSAKPSRPS